MQIYAPLAASLIEVIEHSPNKLPHHDACELNLDGFGSSAWLKVTQLRLVQSHNGIVLIVVV